MKTKRIVWLWATVAWTVSAQAGWFGGGPEQDPSEKLGAIFGNDTAFSAQAQITVTDKKGRETYAGETGYAYLNGKVRAEIDLTKTRAGKKRSDEMEQLKMLGMDTMVYITRPDKNVTFVVYPSMQAYCEMPIEKKKGRETGKPPKVEKTELGNETVDGHPCKKTKVAVTDEDGKTQEFLTWEALDLKGFTVQTEYQEEGNTVRQLFKEIKLTKPPAALFDPPTGSTKHASVQEMMMSNMKKLLQGMGQ